MIRLLAALAVGTLIVGGSATLVLRSSVHLAKERGDALRLRRVDLAIERLAIDTRTARTPSLDLRLEWSPQWLRWGPLLTESGERIWHRWILREGTRGLYWEWSRDSEGQGSVLLLKDSELRVETRYLEGLPLDTSGTSGVTGEWREFDGIASFEADSERHGASYFWFDRSRDSLEEPADPIQVLAGTRWFGPPPRPELELVRRRPVPPVRMRLRIGEVELEWGLAGESKRLLSGARLR